jgi:transposase
VVLACLIIGEAGGKPRREIRRFGTTTRELKLLREWLLSMGCTHVAMESTGVYWKPVYAVLEGSFEIAVGNAPHIKNVPGRKTDVKDCEWIGDLLRHGLIAKSFVPPTPLRELRDLTRYRRKLVEAGARERNDLGPSYLDALKPRRTAANPVRRLRDLGDDVSLQPRAA